MAKIQENFWETFLEYTIVHYCTLFEKDSCHYTFLSLYDTNFFQTCHAEHLRISVWVSLLVHRKLLSVYLGLFAWTEEETPFWINTCIISWEE